MPIKLTTEERSELLNEYARLKMRGDLHQELTHTIPDHRHDGLNARLSKMLFNLHMRLSIIEAVGSDNHFTEAYKSEAEKLSDEDLSRGVQNLLVADGMKKYGLEDPNSLLSEPFPIDQPPVEHIDGVESVIEEVETNA